MNIEFLRKRFTEYFGERQKELIHIFFAPGRINLIGEHVDYNGGRVLPCALSKGTYLLLRQKEDAAVHLASESRPTRLEISLEEIHSKVGSDWWNYPLGVIHEFQKLSPLS